MAPELDELVVADPPEAWEAAGFVVDPDGTCCVGAVRIRLAGRDAGKRIVAWSLRGLPEGTTDVDGLPTTVSDRPAPAPVEHPNGASVLDHVVVLTPDTQRTITTLGSLGVELRRTREVPSEQYGFEASQSFFRVGEPILELLGPLAPSDDGPAGFFGLAWTVTDLDALAEQLGPALGRIKDAVQPGRRIATLRHKDVGMSVATAFMTPLMLDHVFTDAIGALRDTFENALLDRLAFEERFQADVLLGDLTWETSYGLPGEGSPPRVRADITFDWPTWAQTAYRSWYIGEPFDEGPRIEMEIVLRIQRLADLPDPGVVLAALPETSPAIGTEHLERSGPTVETIYGRDLGDAEYAIEVSYEGSYELDEATLADGSTLDTHFGAMGGWIASTLVKLGDLEFQYLPPDEEGDDG